MIFVDTGAWFAAFVPNDPDHEAADEWLAVNAQPLVTTDYVVDELLTLMKVRGEFPRAMRLGASLLTESIVDLHWVSRSDVLAAWDMYRRFSDKGWSFTDCVSRVVMDRLAIDTAFAFDEPWPMRQGWRRPSRSAPPCSV